MPISRDFNFKTGIFLIVYQTALIPGLIWYFSFFTPSLTLIACMLLLLCTGGFSITAGYHRLFSHKCFKTNPVIESIILFFASTTIQGSALRWCNDHRKHHAYVDTDADPYSINKGFFYAHFFWMLEKQEEIDPRTVRDLMQNRRVMFQHRFDNICMFGSNFLIFLAVGFFLDDFVGAFFIGCWLRLFLQHHTTWFINSLAHTWGTQPFCREHSAVNNFIISLLTFGEGYHNFHHTFANDYRNGVRWYQYDPTKWLIWSLSRLGLARELKRVPKMTIQKKMVLEGKDLLLEQLKQLWYVKKEELEQKIHELAESLIIQISKISELTETYNSLCKKQAEKEVLMQLQYEIKSLNAKICADWRHWSNISGAILKLKPIPA